MSYCKLGRASGQRKVMLRDITTDLITNEHIVTTEARIKEVRSTVEKMTTLGKRGGLHAHRQAAILVCNEIASVCEEDEFTIVESALQKLLNDPGSRPVKRQGGYTRILKMEPRHGDVIPMVAIESAKQPINRPLYRCFF